MKKINTIIIGLISAILVCLFAHYYVYRDIEKVRFKLLENPVPASPDGVVGFRYINQRPYEARILAVRINNNSDESKQFTVILNEKIISSTSVKGHSAGRYAAQIPPSERCARCRLVVSSNHTEWGLQTVEVRNMFGFSSAWLKAVVIDHEFKSFSPLQLLELILIFLFTFLVTAKLPDAMASLSKLTIIPACFIGCLAVLLVIVPFVTSYKILLAPSAFVKLWLLSLLPVWITTYRKLRDKPNFKPILVSLLVASTFIGGMLFKLDEYDENFSGFLNISKKYLGRNHILLEHPRIRKELIKVDGNGYDAQFYYFIAWDPFMREYHIAPGAERMIDDPVFRYRRIAYPLLTKIFSLNIPDYYPAVMMFLLIAGTALCSFFMAKIAMIHGWNGFGGLLFIFIPGLWFSLSVATPEAIAAAFLTAGFFMTLKQRYVTAALFYSAAVLTRESTAAFIVILALYEFWKNKSFRVTTILFASLLPYLLWRSFVWITLFDMHRWAGFFFEPGNVGFPLAGVLEMLRRIMNGTYNNDDISSATALPFVLLSILVVSIYFLLRNKHPLALLTAVYSFLALCLTYDKVWKDVSNIERQSYESFLCLVLLYLSRPNNKWKIVFWVAFIPILVYDFFFMIRTDLFYEGFLWLFKS